MAVRVQRPGRSGIAKPSDLPTRESPEVIELIAHNVDTNIRELEGVIVKLIGLASLLGRKIDAQITQEVLREIAKPRDRSIRVDLIQKVIQSAYGVTLTDLQSKSRSKAIALPRQIAMYFARKMTKYSLEEIGGYFGGRDHTTVLHAVQKITEMGASDPAFKYEIDKLAKRIVADSVETN
jgi:chromosomal replication initiator protein